MSITTLNALKNLRDVPQQKLGLLRNHPSSRHQNRSSNYYFHSTSLPQVKKNELQKQADLACTHIKNSRERDLEFLKIVVIFTAL